MYDKNKVKKEYKSKTIEQLGSINERFIQKFEHIAR